MGLRIVPIVEGHGEVRSVRLLLERIWYELLEGTYLDILPPIRRPRDTVVRQGDLVRAVQLAELRLQDNKDDVPGLVLLLIDADGDLPCMLAPQVHAMVKSEVAHLDFACVLANPEWETWFVAAAESLSEFLELPGDRRLPENPEDLKLKKAWIKERFRGYYRPNVHQSQLTKRMDLALCRERSPSFDKLCRELERRL